MKNLLIANHRLYDVPVEKVARDDEVLGSSQLASTSASSLPSHFTIASPISLNAAAQVMYFCDSSMTLYGYSLIEEQTVLSVPLLSDIEEECAVSRTSRVVSLAYVPDSEAVVLALDDGVILEIKVVDSFSGGRNFDSMDAEEMAMMEEFGGDMDMGAPEPVEAGSIDIVGEVPSGITCAEWSPDFEMIVICAKDGKFMVMSKTWDLLSEIPYGGTSTDAVSVHAANPYNFLPEALSRETHVPVSTEEAATAHALASSTVESDATVSWRGDGQFFVISSRNPLTSTRVLRVWDRQGHLQSVSEPLPAGPCVDLASPSNTLFNDGVAPVLSWRQSGNLIAAIQRLTVPQKQQKVVFFERNGLPHGEFSLLPHSHTAFPSNSLPFMPSTEGIAVSQMLWSADSSMLAISGFDRGLGHAVVQVWTTGNYHWYLKRTILLPSCPITGAAWVSIAWQSERTSRLLIVSPSSSSLSSSFFVRVQSLDLIGETIVGPLPLSTAAVIDGQCLLLTHYSRAALPPPLATETLLFPRALAEVTFCTSTPSALSLEAAGGAGTFSGSGVYVPASSLRTALAAPMAVVDCVGDILLPTHGIQTKESTATPSGMTAMVSTSAPASQPSRFMALSSSSATTARPAVFARLPQKSIFSVIQRALNGGEEKENYAIAAIRHVQWVDASQWLTAHIDFASKGTVTSVSNTNTSGRNVITCIASCPDVADIVVALSFRVRFQDNTLLVEDLRLEWARVLKAPVIPGVTSNVRSATGRPMATRVFLVSPGKPLPVAPTATSVTATVDPAVAAAWARAHAEALATPPWLAVALADGQVIRVDGLLSRDTSQSQCIEESDEKEEKKVDVDFSEGVDTLSSQDYATRAMAKAREVWQRSRVGLSEGRGFSSKSTVLSGPILSSISLPAPATGAQVGRVSSVIPRSVPTTSRIGGLSHNHFENSDSFSNDGSVSNTINSDTELEINGHAEMTVTTTDETSDIRLAPLAPDTLHFAVADMHGEHVYIGKDTSARLCVNGLVVAPQCISFQLCVFNELSQTMHMNAQNTSTNMLTSPTRILPSGLLPSFLFVTVAGQQHALFALDLRRSLAENVDPFGAIRGDPHMVRLLERGSALVAAVPDLLRPRLILQMPRGNIEAIYPRAMGLAAVHVALSSMRYREAFTSMRANRIDLNLLYDHDPIRFASQGEAGRFIRELHTPDNLSLFLSALADDDVTQTQFPRYKAMFGEPSTREVLISAVKEYSETNTFGTNGSDSDSDSDNGNHSDTENHIRFHHPNTDMDADVESYPETTAQIASREAKEAREERDMALLAKRLQNSRLNEAESEEQRVALAALLAEDLPLGAEANSNLAADGSGMSLTKQSTTGRLNLFQAVDLDLRQIYAFASTEFPVSDGIGDIKEGHVLALPSIHPFAARVRAEQKAIRDVAVPSTAPIAAFTLDGAANTANATATSVDDDDDDEESSTRNTNAEGAYSSLPPGHKANVVCDLILAALPEIEEEMIKSTSILTSFSTPKTVFGRFYALAALTAHVRKSPPDFQSAVTLIGRIAEAEAEETASNSNSNSNSTSISTSSTSSTSRLKATAGVLPKPKASTLGPRPTQVSRQSFGTVTLVPATAEKALKYLLVIADAAELWEAALARYDLGLASSIARHSGRDPREFLPLISAFHRASLSGLELLPIDFTSYALERISSALLSFGVSLSTALTELSITTTVSVTSPSVTSVVIGEETVMIDRVKINAAVIPSAVGILLQRAAVDAHLGNSPRLLLHWAQALEILDAVVTGQSQSSLLIREESQGSRAKCALIAVAIRRDVTAIARKAGCVDLAVRLFSSPLPPSTPFLELPLSTSTSTPTTATSISWSGMRHTLAREVLVEFAKTVGNHTVGRYNDAALAFRAAGDLVSAATHYGYAGDSSSALALVGLNPRLFGKDTMARNITFTAIANGLTTREDWARLADFQLTWMSQPSLALRTLLDHKLWNQALALVASPISASHPELLADVFVPFVLAAGRQFVTDCIANTMAYREAVRKLRIVRRVKLLIFAASAGIPEAVEAWKEAHLVPLPVTTTIDTSSAAAQSRAGYLAKGKKPNARKAEGQGETRANIDGSIVDPNQPARPQLVARIPGDDVLEFILTGVWRGIQTGLTPDGEGFAGGLAAGSLAGGSIASTASTASLASLASISSLAPSVAASLTSLASGFSTLSGSSVASSSSVLSVAAPEQALTADERRIKKYMRRVRSRKRGKKIREGDPREEAELVLLAASLTPSTTTLAEAAALGDILVFLGHPEEAEKIHTTLQVHIQTVVEEESIPMPTLQGLSTWQREQVKNYFNWPATSRLDERVVKEKLKEKEDERLAEERKISKSQRKKGETLITEQDTIKIKVNKPWEAPVEASWRETTFSTSFVSSFAQLVTSDVGVKNDVLDALLTDANKARQAAPAKRTTTLGNREAAKMGMGGAHRIAVNDAPV